VRVPSALAAIVTIILTVTAGVYTNVHAATGGRVWHTLPFSGMPHLKYASGLTIDTRGASPHKWMYVVDSSNARIVKLGTGGHYITSWTYGPRPGYLDWGAQLAVDSSGNVYLAYASRNRIEKFTPSGKLLATWGTKGAGPGQFNLPRAITVDRQGNIYVADSMNFRIQKLSSSGAPLASWTVPAMRGSGTSRPDGVALDRSGNVYVTSVCNNPCEQGGHAFAQHLLTEFRPNGSLMRERVGGSPYGAEYKDAPWIGLDGVTTDGAGNWYVSGVFPFRGIYASAVAEFSRGGKKLNQWRLPGDVGFYGGIALDPAGNIFVANGVSGAILELSR
jgi:tripartite motif-containing protein 71